MGLVVPVPPPRVATMIVDQRAKKHSARSGPKQNELRLPSQAAHDLDRLLDALDRVNGQAFERPRFALRRIGLGHHGDREAEFGRLAQALGIDPRFDGFDLCAGKTLWIGRIGGLAPKVGVTTRIGLSREQHRRLRFYAIGSRFVSGPRSLVAAQARRHRSRSSAPRPA